MLSVRVCVECGFVGRGADMLTLSGFLQFSDLDEELEDGGELFWELVSNRDRD